MVFDTVVIVIIFVSALIAFFRGLIRETLTILGVAGGAVGAVYIGPLISPAINSWVTPEKVEDEAPAKFFDIIPYPILADIIAYGSVFIVFVIVLSIISHFLAGWAKSIGLGLADRLFGVAFGVARGVLMVAILWLPVYLLVDKEDRQEWGWVKTSITVSYVDHACAFIHKFLPSDAEEKIEETKSKAESAAKQTIQEMEAKRLKDREDRAKGSGYDDQERENMDNLIKDSFNE
jgi:membrane protein required for colicin V production